MDAKSKLDIAGMIATSADGYGAVIDGVLNIRTVTDSPRAVGINALYFSGCVVICVNDDCDCVQKLIDKHYPNIKIVPVRVAVSG